MADLEIYGGAASNYVWVCRIACVEKRVPHKHIHIRPHTPEVDAIHPLGKIPVMRHGDVTLAESRAICGYLERMFDGPPLIPADPIKAAQVEQWVSLVNTAIDPVWVRQYLASYIRMGTLQDNPDRARIDAAVAVMEKQFPIIEDAVKSGYFVGNSFTLADINFIPILSYMPLFPEGAALLGKHKKLKAYLEKHAGRKSVQETLPDALKPKTEASASQPSAASA